MPQSPLARSFQAATAHCHGLPAARSFARARRWTIARAEQGGESRHCFEPIGARRLEDFLIGHPWISLALSQDIVSTWQLWGEMKDSWKQVKKTVMNTSGKSIDAYIQLHIYIYVYIVAVEPKNIFQLIPLPLSPLLLWIVWTDFRTWNNRKPQATWTSALQNVCLT